MNKETVIATLRSHAPELQAAGLMHLSLFGSVVRGEATADSDIDLLAEYDATKRLTLLGVAGLEVRLAKLLGTKVDLASRDGLHELIRDEILQETYRVF